MKLFLFLTKRLSIVICCLFYFGACQLDTPLTVESLFQESFAAVEISDTEITVGLRTRTSVNQAEQVKNTAWKKAASFYEKGQHQAAVKALQAYLETYPESHKARLLVSMSLFLEQRVPEAVNYLDWLLAQPDGLYFEHAQWLRALAYLHEEDLTEAKNTLHRIVLLDWHHYRENAEALLPKIEALQEERSQSRS